MSLNILFEPMLWPLLIKRWLLVFSVFLGVFYFYRRGRLLGFGREKLLDVAILPLSASFLLYVSLGSLPSVRFGASLIIFFSVLSYLTYKQGWSYPRVADLAAEAAALAMIIFPPLPLLLNLLFLILFFILRKTRTLTPKSGLVSYIFLIFFSLGVVLTEVVQRRIFVFNTVFMMVVALISLVKINKERYISDLPQILQRKLSPLLGVTVIYSKLKSFLARFRKRGADTGDGVTN